MKPPPFQSSSTYPNRLKFFLPLICILSFSFILFTGCRTNSVAPQKPESWRGVDVPVQSDEQLSKLEGNLAKFAAVGINAIVIEVDYHFEFQSRPELRDKPYITKVKAREFVQAARKLGIRVIPEMDCLGHQSMGGRTLPLLTKYPDLDETRGLYPGNKGIYCRSWCPSNPDVERTIFPLIDEVSDAFQADAFHVGMDEVFIIANTNCPRCRDQDPAKLFAKTVNDFHDHIVGKKKLTMLMWGDRFLNAQTMHYGRWESATNGTAPAVDSVPRDIIICDWHYRAQTNYPSVPFFLDKGFRVWPAGFQPAEAAKAFSDFSLKERAENPHVLGYLATTWSKANTVDLASWPPITENLPAWVNK